MKEWSFRIDGEYKIKAFSVWCNRLYDIGKFETRFKGKGFYILKNNTGVKFIHKAVFNPVTREHTPTKEYKPLFLYCGCKEELVLKGVNNKIPAYVLKRVREL